MQPSFHLFCDVVKTWSVGIKEDCYPCFSIYIAIYMPVRFAFWLHMPVSFSFMSGRLNCWGPSLSAVLICLPVVADPSILEQWLLPFPLAKRVAVSFPPPPSVVHTQKSLEFSQRLFPRFVFGRTKPIVTAENSLITVPFDPILINPPKHLFSAYECYWSCLNLIKLIFSV